VESYKNYRNRYGGVNCLDSKQTCSSILNFSVYRVLTSAVPSLGFNTNDRNSMVELSMEPGINEQLAQYILVVFVT
jgi:hypothetical protein